MKTTARESDSNVSVSRSALCST